MLLVRAVVRAADAAVAARDDLVVVSAGEVAALASRHARPPDPSADALREHAAIAARIHDRVPSLPARFGTLFPDEPGLARALRSRDGALGAALGHVGTRVELAVTLRWRAPIASERPVPASGRDHLRRAADRERRSDEARAVVARLLVVPPLERALTRDRICPRDGVAATLAILLERNEVETVRQAISSFAVASSDVTVTIHGPLPPYSFAS